jgi:hypothetical protein
VRPEIVDLAALQCLAVFCGFALVLEVLDYIYVSYTNSIAFSPTDVLPLTRWAKLLMLSESAVSAVTVLLVAARAVNIFK